MGSSLTKKKEKQRRVRCIAVIVAFIVVFFIGFLIGYVALKAKESRKHKGDRGHKDKKADFQKHHEEIMNQHKAFQSGVSEEQLEESLK